jgi:RNA polymerase sigma factor (sigma-70 family)
MLAADNSPDNTVTSLYENHHSWLQTWLRKKLGNAFDAADLAHDTYVRIMVSGATPQPAQSRQFLTQIANGLMIDLFRRRQIEAAYLEAIGFLPEAQVPSEETRAIIIEALIEVDTLLNTISAKARVAFLLCKLDGLTYREIAAKMGVSLSSVEKYIVTALEACYQAMYVQDNA